MFNIDNAKEKVLSFGRVIGKATGTASWRVRGLEGLSDGLSQALTSLPEQGASDELHYVLGRDQGQQFRYARMEKMPHLLVAGTTGSGKSVFINGLLVSLLARHDPSTLRLGLVDPKLVEFACYNDLPHLIGGGVANGVDTAMPIIDECVREMEKRLHMMVKARVKDLASYNARMPEGSRLPRIVLVVDEFADIILGAVTKEEKAEVQRFEIGLTRLAQKARAAGIHLVLATQKPITKVVTTVLRSNIPSRVALKVSTASDSRIILDEGGAELLNGMGDMLFKAPTGGAPIRLQGVWVPDDDIMAMIEGD